MAIKVKKTQLSQRVGRLRALSGQRNKIFRIANEKTRNLISRRFANTTSLANFRKRQVDLINKVNQEYVRNTQDVLNKQTLDYLVEHSTIDAPTLISIFAGYELARASRAERLDKKRESEVQQAQSSMKLAELRTKQQNELLSAQADLYKEQRDYQLKELDYLGDAISKDVEDRNKAELEYAKNFNTAEIRQEQFDTQTENNKRTTYTSTQNNIRTTKTSSQNNERSTSASIEAANIRATSAEDVARIKREKNKTEKESFNDWMNKRKQDNVKPSGTPPINIPKNKAMPPAPVGPFSEAPDNTDYDVVLNDLPATVPVLDHNLNPPVVDVETNQEVVAQVTYINPDTQDIITIFEGEEVPDGFVKQTEVLT